MEDHDLGTLLTEAADRFPVAHVAPSLRSRIVRRRRRRAAVGLAGSAAVLAGVAVLVPFVVAPGPGDGGDPSTAASQEAGTAYVGVRWRLTGVADAAGRTTVPAEVGASLELYPDGRIVINDSINGMSGRYVTTADGFEVRDVSTTLALYGGTDAHRLAAVAGLRQLAYGNQAGTSPPAAVHDVVESATSSALVVKAGGMRLTFERVVAAGG